MAWYGALLASLSAVLAVPACFAGGRSADAPTPEVLLTREITQLDTGLFDSFNHCDDPAAFQKHAGYLDEHLEFYHDKGGVTWTRKDYLDKTRANVCGVFRRKIVEGSIHVYPVAGFGAIEEGRHEFCPIKQGDCFGVAKFMIVWQQTPKGWKATRILSYGHEAL